MATTPELVLDCRNTLGDGVVWCAERKLLFWVDVERAELWQLNPPIGQTRTWKLSERIASFALRKVGGMVVALASGIALFDPESGEVTRVADLGTHLHATRLNDGRCDRHGRFFVGSMDDLHA
jgi:L-arabinonolactonase